MSDVAKLNPTHVSRLDALSIANQIDGRAGGFFHNALIRAAMMGAELQRAKLEKADEETGSWNGLRERYADQA